MVRNIKTCLQRTALSRAHTHSWRPDKCCVLQKSHPSPKILRRCCRETRFAFLRHLSLALQERLFPLLLGSCSSDTLHASLSPPHSSSRPAQFFFHVLSCHCQQAQSHRTYSQYNAKFEFSYTFEGQPCNFVMTSVLGHLFATDFVERCVTCLFPRTCFRANCFWPCTWPRSFPKFARPSRMPPTPRPHRSPAHNSIGPQAA